MWFAPDEGAEELRREVQMKKTKGKKKDVIAHRKGCKVTGTGLSHYVLAEKKS